MEINSQTKIALGSVLGVFGALGMVLLFLVGVSEVPDPWGFLLAFVVGVLAGVGVTLAIAGLIERRRSI